jgi:hypothetical protein
LAKWARILAEAWRWFSINLGHFNEEHDDQPEVIWPGFPRPVVPEKEAEPRRMGSYGVFYVIILIHMI